MIKNTSTVYITDKTGEKMFVTGCSTQYVSSEIHNLNCKLREAKQYPDSYKFLDIETARIVRIDADVQDWKEDEPLDFTMSDDELLKLLGV